MQQANVLHLISTLEIGGAEVQLVNIVRNLDSEVYNSVVCCIAKGGPLTTELSKRGIKVVVLSQKSRFNPLVLLPLYCLIKKERINIVHTHMFRANLWGRLAALFAGVSVIIATEHGLNPWKNFIHIMINRILAFLTTQIITVSNVGRRIRIQREGINPKKLITIHNCVDLHRFDKTADVCNNIRQEFNMSSDESVVGFVGRLQEVKGVRYLIESFVELKAVIPKVKLLIVGDGTLKASLHNYAQKLGVGEQIIFAGYRRDIPQVLNAMNVFVLPSLREDLPLSPIEAMAMKKPVVATNAGGIPEVVTDGETGILVPPKDATALAKAISRILLDEQLARKMGLAGRQRVEKQFSADTISSRIQQLYSSLMREKGNRQI